MNQKILHYPRLDTMVMVEETIKKLDFYPTKMELKLDLSALQSMNRSVLAAA